MNQPFRCKSSYLLLLILCFLFAFSIQAQTVPSGFSYTSVGSGWVAPVGVTFNKSGTKMFVWEKGGTVYVSDWNSSTQTYVKQSTPLLNISEEVGDWRDHGLLGFTLDPNFDVNGLFYVMYVVDRHHLLNFGTPAYNAGANSYFDATIGRVTRYQAITNGSNQLVANAASRFILLGETKSTGIPILYESHGVGTLAFAADGTLLISAGDGASFSVSDQGSVSHTYYIQALADGIIRPNENVGSFRSQLVDCHNGKILRIDPVTGDGIPSNPFYSASAPRSPKSRVWALGFRNPFRITVRPNTGSLDRTTGDLGEIYVGDVGLNLMEELTILRAPAQNGGWPMYEGITDAVDYVGLSTPNKDEPNPLFGTGGCNQQFFTFQNLVKQATADNVTTVFNPCNPSVPITGGPANRYFHRVPALDWNHTSDSARVKVFNGNNLGVAQIGTPLSGVTGIPFRGSSSIAGCWYTGNMFPSSYKNTYFHADYGSNWIKNMTIEFTDQVKRVDHFASGFIAIVHVAENPLDGSLFTVDIGNNTIRKIVYGGNQPPVARISADKKFGPGPLLVNFNGSASSDPEAGLLTYSWDFGDGTALSTQANPAHTFTPPNSSPRRYVVKLTVRDNLNAVHTDSVIISANNTPPVVNIISPVKNSSYTVGPDTTYTLQATVTDAEHGPSQLSYRWQTILRHNTHEHQEPIDTNPVTSAIITRVGCNGETYYWFIRLTVTDGAGLITEDSAKIFPACASAPPTINGNPSPQNICEGSIASFSSTVSDLPLPQVQWQRSTNNGSSWTSIAGANNPTYQFTPLLSDNGNLYRAIWSNSIGADTSSPALLTVNPSPAAPSGTAAQTFCFLPTVQNLSASGSGIKWYSTASGGTALAASTPLVSGNHYYASQTINGCESVQRLDVTVTINSSAGNSVTLNGSGSTGPVTSYLWTLVSGPNTPVIATPTAVNTTVSGLTQGTYIFQLSLNNGASVSQVAVNVNPPAVPLVANAGFDRAVTLPLSVVTLNGSGSTGSILTYSWTKITGPNNPVINSNSNITTQVTGLVQGVYTFELAITDNNSNLKRDTVAITVLPAPSGGTTPVISASNPVIGTNSTVLNNLIAVPPGALIVLTVAQADEINDGANANVTSVPALTWTKRADASATVSGNAEIYTAVHPTGGNLSITTTWAVNQISAVAYAVTNYDPSLSGAAATGANQSAPSVAITSTRTNSLLFGVSSDWNAINGATRVYRDNPVEMLYNFRTNIYAGYHYYKPTTSTGTYTLGLSAPTGMSAGTALFEVVGPPGGPAAPVADAGFNQTVFFALPPSGAAVQQFCNSATLASLSVSGTGIKWYDAASGGNELPLSTPLVNGTHYFASQSVNGCESVQRLDVTAQVQAPPAPPVINVVPNCNGTVVLSTTEAGTYLWSTGATTSSIVVTASGSYSLTRTNAGGCSSTNSVLVTVSNTGLTAVLQNQVNILCFGESTGSVSVQVSGGTTPYSYVWSTGAVTTGISGVAAGNYNVVVSDASGCSVTIPVTITQPAAALSLNTTQTNIAIFGASTGSISANASGGTAPYTYSLDNISYQNPNTFSGLPAGTYTVYAKDANNCLQQKTVILTQPGSALILQTAQTSVLCFGAATGSITATGSGGTPPYQFRLNSGALQPTGVFNGLVAGNYTVTIQDAGGATTGTVIQITQPASGPSFTTAKVDISCLNSSGSITVTATGGTAPYTYSKDGGSTYQSSNSFTGLSGGNYSIRVKDAADCITGTQTVTINTSATSVTLTGSGSTGSPSSYLWTLVSGPNTPVIVSPNAANTTVNGLLQGTYVFRLSVNGGASVSDVLVNVNPPASPVTAHAGFDRTITLPSSVFTLDGNGSTGTISSYLWSQVSGPNTSTISSPGNISSSVSGLIQGTYVFQLTVRDALNTAFTDQVQLVVNAAPSGGSAPVIVSTVGRTSNTNTVVNPLTAVPAGALIVLTIAQADDVNDAANATVTSTPALTWTKRVEAGVPGSGNTEIYTAVFTAGGSLSITSRWAVNAISATAYVITNFDPALTGASATGVSQTAPSVAITTTRSNSLIVGVSSDWAAINGASRVYRDAATESQYHFRTNIYGAYHYRKATTAAGTYTQGLSAPTGMAASTCLLEIRGPLGSVVPIVANAGFNQTIGCVSGGAAMPLITMNSKATGSGPIPASVAALRIYPNPGSGRFQLQMAGLPVGKAKLRITDARGQLIVIREFTVTNNPHLEIVDLGNKANGVYLVQVIHGGGALNGKLIKE